MKTVLITGANQGIGLEAAKQLLQKDCFVYLGCRDHDKGMQAKQTLQDSGWENVDLLMLDVTDIDSIRQARQSLESKSARLDVLINNAGTRGEIPQPASTVSVDEIRSIFETNFFGAIQVAQAFIPLLKKSDAPVIVNVTSDLGSLAFRSDATVKSYTLPRAGYGPSKTALNAYTVALAVELRETAFKVNCVNPGHTATAFNDFAGIKPAAQGAAVIVKYALLDQDGPTGKFFSEEGETPW